MHEKHIEKLEEGVSIKILDLKELKQNMLTQEQESMDIEEQLTKMTRMGK